MSFLVKIFATLVLTALVAGVLTYPMWAIVSHFAEYRSDRVMHRLWELLILLSVWWLLKREGVATHAMFGYAMPRPQFLRQITIGFVAGLTLMVPLVVGLVWLDIRARNPNVDASILIVALEGAIAGIAIGFLEESITRGAVFSGIARESGAVAAILFTSLLFAAAHFLRGQLRIPAEAMNFKSGLQLIGDIFADFATPLQITDAVAALFALGVLLSLIRLRTDAIAGSIGLHAGGVAVIAVVSKITIQNPVAHPTWLIPSYNNVVGYLAFAWISFVTVVYWAVTRTRKGVSQS